MKMKAGMALLSLAVLLLTGNALVNYERLKNKEKTLADRERTLTAYMKVVDAIGRTEVVEFGRLQGELLKDFDIKGEGGDMLLIPKDPTIRSSSIWEYLGGLSLQIDERGYLLSVKMHKH